MQGAVQKCERCSQPGTGVFLIWSAIPQARYRCAEHSPVPLWSPFSYEPNETTIQAREIALGRMKRFVIDPFSPAEEKHE